MRSLSVTPEANRDILDAMGWYARRSAGLAGRFEDALDRRTESIREAPDQYALVPDGHDHRQAILTGFPYSIVF